MPTPSSDEAPLGAATEVLVLQAIDFRDIHREKIHKEEKVMKVVCERLKNYCYGPKEKWSGLASFFPL